MIRLSNNIRHSSDNINNEISTSVNNDISTSINNSRSNTNNKISNSNIEVNGINSSSYRIFLNPKKTHEMRKERVTHHVTCKARCSNMVNQHKSGHKFE